jgi:hypothetical protein
MEATVAAALCGRWRALARTPRCSNRKHSPLCDIIRATMVVRSEFAAFFSYVHTDDEQDDGALQALCRRLSGEVRAVTGIDFPIFFDRSHISWGQNWRRRIEQSLDATTFLIPVITPSYLRSDQCKNEFLAFLKREARLGRDDLILPIYYITAPQIDSRSESADEVAATVRDRQYADWRRLRNVSPTASRSRTALTSCAEQIHSAMSRSAEFSQEAVDRYVSTCYPPADLEQRAEAAGAWGWRPQVAPTDRHNGPFSALYNTARSLGISSVPELDEAIQKGIAGFPRNISEFSRAVEAKGGRFAAVAEDLLVVLLTSGRATRVPRGFRWGSAYTTPIEDALASLASAGGS